MSLWDDITVQELRTAAKVARASGGVMMSGAAEAWELRARMTEELAAAEQLSIWLNV